MLVNAYGQLSDAEDFGSIQQTLDQHSARLDSLETAGEASTRQISPFELIAAGEGSGDEEKEEPEGRKFSKEQVSSFSCRP